MLPIIFGIGPRQEELGGGEFHCPNCEQPRQYQRLRSRNYFRLYFIPVLPLGDGEEIIQCQTCGVVFPPAVLEAEPKPKKRKVRPLAQQLNTLQARLQGGEPVEYVVAELTAAGLDRDLARENVRQAIGAGRQQCPQCGLSYAPGVATCQEDGVPLDGQNT